MSYSCRRTSYRRPSRLARLAGWCDARAAVLSFWCAGVGGFTVGAGLAAALYGG